MRILVLGNGGREHAIGHALAQSTHAPELFFAPGNPGTALLGLNLGLDPDDETAALSLAEKYRIDLTIVGPEVPLVRGIVDQFEAEGRLIVGPTAAAARLEGSKAFSKAFMERHGIPSAHHRTFVRDQYADAVNYLREQGAPIVIKASGLAAGKGAIVCMTLQDAFSALKAIFEDDAFGRAGDEVVIEEFMYGEEASIFVLTDGEACHTLLSAQDHKPIGEGDTGPNTGGMGAYAPAPLVDDYLLERIETEIVRPTLSGMREEGHPYRGILYVGVMVTDEGPRVVEYNCRLGDPEAQVVLPMLENDAVEVFQRIAERSLSELRLKNRSGAAATVVLASAGYPGHYETGFPVVGLEHAEKIEGVTVFHAGTRLDDNARIITSGGRVLSVTAVAESLRDALNQAYEAADAITFEGKYFRRDIGKKGIARLT